MVSGQYLYSWKGSCTSSLASLGDNGQCNVWTGPTLEVVGWSLLLVIPEQPHHLKALLASLHSAGDSRKATSGLLERETDRQRVTYQ